jgi:hypothetical protein
VFEETLLMVGSQLDDGNGTIEIEGIFELP